MPQRRNVSSRFGQPLAQCLGGMSTTRFLREYWQKKPLLVRGAFADFQDPISPDELAGLSCEDGVESRIVRERGGSRPWEVIWGPHPEKVFMKLPERDWTLLVQEVNRHVPAVAEMLDPFAFIPNVRVDDVMISFAAPGGSVGPHLDSYDVFLVQGAGQRRWKYGTRPARDTSLEEGRDLRILRRFRPDVDEVLEAGDMLYLPPGFAHHGVAVTPCLTYSIGFRSPNAGEMWSSFAAWLARTKPEAKTLLVDPPLSATADPGAVPPAMLSRVRAVLRGALRPSNDDLDRWFLSFATELKPGHELEPPRRAIEDEALFARLERGPRGAAVARSEEGRWAYLPRPKGALLLYVGGVEIAVDAGAAALARLLCSRRRFSGQELAVRNASSRALVRRLFTLGALRFAPASRASRASGR